MNYNRSVKLHSDGQGLHLATILPFPGHAKICLPYHAFQISDDPRRWWVPLSRLDVRYQGARSCYVNLSRNDCNYRRVRRAKSRRRAAPIPIRNRQRTAQGKNRGSGGKNRFATPRLPSTL